MAPDAVRVREATPDDLVATMNVIDGAGLAVDLGRVRERLAAGDVLLAVADGGGSSERERVLGALVLDPAGPPWAGGVDDDGGPSGSAGGGPAHVVAVAVRRRRRDRGLGTALVEVAGERVASGEHDGRLTAAFRSDVRPFYESLGFAVTGETADGRLRGVRDDG